MFDRNRHREFEVFDAYHAARFFRSAIHGLQMNQ